MGGEQGGGNPGVMGVGSLREAGEEGAGSKISKVGWSQEKWEKFHNIGTIFSTGKAHRGGNCYGRGREPGVQGAGGTAVSLMHSESEKSAPIG